MRWPWSGAGIEPRERRVLVWGGGILLLASWAALLSRQSVWRQIDLYVQSLEEAEFRRALVPLRRAFSGFRGHELRNIVGILVELSSEGVEELERLPEKVLSDDEAKKLTEDLGDLGL